MGQRFGLSQQDIATITGWLESQGLHVNWVAPSGVFIGFGGTAADVGRAFGTELHNYNVNGKMRISVASDPAIPAALAPAIKSVRGLYTINDHPTFQAALAPADAPMLTTTSGHFLAPADFNTIYNVPASQSGAGETIGIVSWAHTYMTDFNNFKTQTGATFANPTEVVSTAFGGVDPGPALTSPPTGNNANLGGQEEATLDVQRAGSVAPGAKLLLVISASTGTNDGIGADAQYLVQTSPVPAQAMNISFGDCETNAGQSGVTFWDTLFKQAAAEGISVFVSSGDSGAAECDVSFQTPPATAGTNSPNYICSSSYATCVGGTQFNDTSNTSTYWNASNGTGLSSAIGYIPEGGWNESWNGTTPSVAASGGGVSSFIATPSWQTGAGVPSARTGRYTPDLSFSGACHDGYFACMTAGGGTCGATGFIYFCGTSAAAPAMAGVAALLDQKLGSAQGNLNPEIYKMAASAPTAFHDTTVASME